MIIEKATGTNLSNYLSQKFLYDGEAEKLIYRNLKNQINRFEEKDLEMLAEQIEISIKGDQNKYDSINDQRLKLNQRKILFIVNYAMSNASNPVSAFISYKYRENINKKYLEKIYENLSEEIKNSFYGDKLSSSF